MLSLDLRGCTRIVLLTKNHAIKLPNFRHSWQVFLMGLVANLNEKHTWQWNSGRYEQGRSHLLCPVTWCSWGGWVLVMKRAVPCRWLDEGGEDIDFSKWVVEGLGGDDKPANYGTLDGRIVKLDYGS
jgi:hypothetical protein